MARARRQPSRKNAAGAAGIAAARFCAVQALYQLEISHKDPQLVAREHADYWTQAGLAEYELPPPQEKLLRAIVLGAAAQQKAIDARLGALLKQDWELGRLDSILRALLRAAAWELLYRKAAEPRQLVAAYTDMAHAFCEARAAGMANAILDRLARERA